MSRQEMEITITPSGEVKVNIIGAQGEECLDVSEFLEEALGHVEERQLKSEFYQKTKPTQQSTLQNQQY